MQLTYRYRVKDKHSRTLNRMAREVNFVWNYCNDLQKHCLKWGKAWPTTMGITYFLAGASAELALPANTVNAIGQQYVRSRRQHRRPYLRYRGQKSLGWIPLKGKSVWAKNEGFFFNGEIYSVWLSRKVPKGAKVCDGSNFSQDARGRWFLNIVIDLPDIKPVSSKKAVGIDLGLKDLATLSTGQKIEAPQHYRKNEHKLARAQRARKKRQVKKIHDKIKAQRRDFLHKAANDIVAKHDLIVVGNVNSSGLKRTRMAKSVSDAGWHSFKNMLAYKSIANGARYIEVNEAYTTQTCSGCGSISGPKGREGLGVREWQCSCGSIHDRDQNSALNILRIGQDTLTGAAA